MNNIGERALTAPMALVLGYNLIHHRISYSLMTDHCVSSARFADSSSSQPKWKTSPSLGASSSKERRGRRKSCRKACRGLGLCEVTPGPIPVIINAVKTAKTASQIRMNAHTPSTSHSNRRLHLVLRTSTTEDIAHDLIP